MLKSSKGYEQKNVPRYMVKKAIIVHYQTDE